MCVRPWRFGWGSSPAHLPPVSWCLPAAPCAPRSPILHPAPLRDPVTEGQPSGPASLCASVPLPPQEEHEAVLLSMAQEGSAKQRQTGPSSQAPLNTGASARAIAVSPHGDTLGHDERALQQAGSYWANSKQVAAPEEGDVTQPRGPKITQRAEMWLGLLVEEDGEREGMGGRHPHPCSEL